MRSETLATVVLPDLSVRIMSGVLEENGFCSASALEAAGLDPTLPRGTPGTVSGEQEFAFQKAFVQATEGRPDLWVQAGLRYRLPSYGALGMAVMTAPTLNEANRTSVASWDLNYSMADRIEISTAAGLVTHTLIADAVTEEMRAFTHLRDLAASLVALHDLWNGSIPIRRITVALPHSNRAPTHILGHPVAYAADQTAWHWPEELADLRLYHGDSVLHQAYVMECERATSRARPPDDFMAMLQSAMATLDFHELSLHRVAAEMSYSERTLQRRLDARDLRFRDVVDEARRHKATRLVSATELPIAEVAWKLGYADVSSFNHAFRRWTGTSPSQMRRSGRPARH